MKCYWMPALFLTENRKLFSHSHSLIILCLWVPETFSAWIAFPSWRVSLLLYYLRLTALPALISTALCSVCARSIAFDHSSVAFTFLTGRLWTCLFQHYKVAPAVPRLVASWSCVWVVRGAGRGHVEPHSFWQPVQRSTELPAWLWARIPSKGAGEDEELIT